MDEDDHILVSIPVTVDFLLLGREDPHRCEVSVPTAAALDYEPGDFEVDSMMEMVSSFVDEMFEARSLQRAQFDGPDGFVYGIKLAEVQAYTIHPVPIEVVDKIIEEAING